jgi:HAD superfamily hydrolase (TIGR01509 family)
VTDVLLLDYNGVVVDDEPLHFAAFRDVLAVERIALDRTSYDTDYLGYDDRACFVEAFRRAGRSLDRASLDRLAARKADWYAELARAGLPVVPGVQDFVRAAAAHTRIGVVSGALRAEIRAGLEYVGISDLVSAVVSAEDVACGKPDPAGLRLALAQLTGAGSSGTRAVVVEDSLPGLAAARALGAGCVALTTSHSARELAGADCAWGSFAGHRPEELAPWFRMVGVRGRA